MFWGQFEVWPKTHNDRSFYSCSHVVELSIVNPAFKAYIKRFGGNFWNHLATVHSLIIFIRKANIHLCSRVFFRRLETWRCDPRYDFICAESRNIWVISNGWGYWRLRGSDSSAQTESCSMDWTRQGQSTGSAACLWDSPRHALGAATSWSLHL